MDIYQPARNIFITCNQRMSEWVKQEVEDLGYRVDAVFKTGVSLQGNFTDCIRLNLHLRCAGQVLMSLQKFRAHHADDVYAQLKQFPWEDIIPEDGYFSVTSHVRTESVTNPLFVNVRIKDAIADRFRERTGKRPDSGPELSGVVVHLHWVNDAAELFLDTSGETLAKHGYRKIPGKAPMIEALACATIQASRWNRTTPFINPMCGSGTLAIEAALLASRKYPGWFRSNYSFMHTCGYDAGIFLREKRAMQAKKINLPGKYFVATDISADAIEIAQVNAKMAGVEEMIAFKQCDFADTPIPPSDAGVIFFNPEYGDRLGAEQALQVTYKRMGDFLKKNGSGYWGYIFTGNLELAKSIGLKPKRRLEFFNGKIDCRLLEYELYQGSRQA